MRLILLGPPGAGKGTQATIVSQELGLAHIASGDLFRQALERGNELGLLAKSYMERGELVPDEITIRMILERVATPDCSQGFILDGFPRTLEQAKALDQVLIESGKTIDKAVYIKVSTQELLRRLSERWICRNCQTPYNILTSPPRETGRCDHCGGELYQRPDDIPERVQRRLEVYLAETMPLVEYYEKMGKLVEVNGEQAMGEVSRELMAALARFR
ncbi:adenylate kinase [Chloroflexota bacterium]